MRVFVWLFRAAILFTLFAFAQNNREDAVIHWFFNQEWRAPMVLIVLAVFALGCAFGVFAMVPAWWRHRRIARKHAPMIAAAPDLPATMPAREITLPHPPRDGL